MYVLALVSSTLINLLAKFTIYATLEILELLWDGSNAVDTTHSMGSTTVGSCVLAYALYTQPIAK